jgi:hypothetical protein
MVQQAGSGHPGLPLGAATMAYALWTQQLKHHRRTHCGRIVTASCSRPEQRGQARRDGVHHLPTRDAGGHAFGVGWEDRDVGVPARGQIAAQPA